MPDSYYNLLLSFKGYAYSKQFRSVRDMMLAVILNNPLPEAEPTTDTSTEVAEPVNRPIDQALTDLVHPVLRKIQFSPELVNYFKVQNNTGAPFSNFECEPRQVSQLKKLMNALYYCELAFKGLENLDIDTPTKYLKLPPKIKDAVENAYKAIRLATKLDVDLHILFEPQLAALGPVFFLFKQMMPKEKWASVKLFDIESYWTRFKTNPMHF